MKRHPLEIGAGILLLFLSGPEFSALGRQGSPGRRYAVVVGNNAYPGSPLRACRNDAQAIGRALQDVGFTVTFLEDATRQSIANTLSSMTSKLRSEDVFFFYFSGHGSQAEGENFLIPVDYDGDSVESLRLNSISANEIQRLSQRARIRILVLDACRTNPYARSRAGGDGLALMEARGTLIAFATGANQVARDGSSEGNGLFTAALLEALKMPGLTVDEVFKRARQKVYAETNGQQWPAVYNDLTSDVVLRPGTPPSTPAKPSSQSGDLDRREELALWESIKDLKDPRVFEDYLQRYPNGKFKVAAEARLAELGVTPTPPRPTIPSGAGGPIEAEAIDLDGPFTLLLEKTPDIHDQKFLQFPNLEGMIGYLKDDPYWKNGEYSITSIAAGNDGILLVLSKLTNEAQSYVYAKDFPQDEVKTKWDEGYRITEVGVVPENWFVVMTKNSGYGSQNFWIQEKWPADFIKKQWDTGQRITHARWRDGKYVVVTSDCQGRKIAMQRWKKGWDEAWIKESREKGLVISLVIPATDETYYVMSEFPAGYDGVRITDDKRFPAEDLAKKMAEGFWLTFLY